MPWISPAMGLQPGSRRRHSSRIVPTSLFYVLSGGLETSYDDAGTVYYNNTVTASGNLVGEGPPTSVDVILVGGGGGGGAAAHGSTVAGSGGGGGRVIDQTVTLEEDTYPVVIGAGGAAVTANNSGNDGSPSTFFGLTALGGGGGGALGAGRPGGSGGGGNVGGADDATSGGYGFDGGVNTNYGAGGGGAGETPTGYYLSGGVGGNGRATTIRGSTEYFGGGGGGETNIGNPTPGAPGGLGGGGTGSNLFNNGSTAGTANTGGGGGGGSVDGRAGGSGVLITRYQALATTSISDMPGLSGITQPYFAVSMRQLHSLAQKCVRVKRASDSTEMEIGFVAGWIDTATIATFCSGTTGYISRWYDQVYNRRFLIPAGTNGPIIYQSGAVTVSSDNSLPCATFAGANALKMTKGRFSMKTHAFSLVGKQSSAPADYAGVLCFRPPTGNDFANINSFSFSGRAAADPRGVYANSGNYECRAGTATLMRFGQHAHFRTTGLGGLYTANTLFASDASFTDPTGSNEYNVTEIVLGGRYTSSAYDPQLHGNIQEMIWWNASMISDRTTIYNHADDAFSVP